MKRIGSEGFSCSCCGKNLEPNDLVEVCADCGAIFCKECAEMGELKAHSCDEYKQDHLHM